MKSSIQEYGESNYLHNGLRQYVVFDIAFRSSLNQKQFFGVFENHSFNVRIRVFSNVMTKLSVAGGNNNISRRAGRKIILQLQVDIVRVIEDKEPISIGLACEPAQTCIYCLLGLSWGNGLEVRLNSLFARGVNVEYIKKA